MVITILWQIIIVILFAASTPFSARSTPARRIEPTCSFCWRSWLLSAVVWQAVGLGVARVHMLLAGIDLEKLAAARKARE